MRRVARSLIRIIAACLMGFGIIEMTFEIVRRRAHGGEISAGPLLLGAGLLAGGIILFATSGRLAKKLTADFDE